MAGLTEEGAVSDSIADLVSLVPSSSKIQMLIIPCKTSDKSGTKKSAKKEARRPAPFSEEWVIKQVIEDDRTNRIGMHLRQWMTGK